MDDQVPSKPRTIPKNYGFDLYPQRRDEKSELSFYDKFKWNFRYTKNIHEVCEYKVMEAINNNPLIKLLMGALKKAGCPIKLKRHIACEECESVVTGGYDPEFNQIVICENSTKGRNGAESTLVHELIHMYDHCVGNVDFKNLEHLACTEIRAANLAHCSFLSSFFIAQSSLFNIKRTHQYCVKMKAAQSMTLSRDIDFETAMDAILKVFNKCYNDLEPIGRRIRRNSADMDLAYDEAIHMGFCEP